MQLSPTVLFVCKTVLSFTRLRALLGDVGATLFRFCFYLTPVQHPRQGKKVAPGRSSGAIPDAIPNCGSNDRREARRDAGE